jgi:hypothetical protein
LLVAPATKVAAPTLKPIADLLSANGLSYTPKATSYLDLFAELVPTAYSTKTVVIAQNVAAAMTDSPNNTSLISTLRLVRETAVYGHIEITHTANTANIDKIPVRYIRRAMNLNSTPAWADSVWVRLPSGEWETLTFTPASGYSSTGIIAKLNRATRQIGLNFSRFQLANPRSIGDPIGGFTFPAGYAPAGSMFREIHADLGMSGRVSMNVGILPNGNIPVYEILQTQYTGVSPFTNAYIYGQLVYNLDVV